MNHERSTKKKVANKKTKTSSSKRSSKKRMKKRIRKIILLELVILCLFIPFIFIYLQLNKIENYEINPADIDINEFHDPNIKEYQNIVVYGVDSRANDLKKNTRSDSIMIISIHKKSKKIKIASVYRDSYLYIDPSHGKTKINHAYAYGGPTLSMSTLNRNLDLNITDFVTVNFSALTNVIDLLGGIELDITETELDWVNKYTKDVAGINKTKATYLKHAGKQTVTGTQATAYCRVRYTKGGDFTRAERQRTVIGQILKKMKSTSIPTLLSIYNEIAPQIYTSFSKNDILLLATGIFSYNIEDTTGFPFEHSEQRINSADVVVPTTLSSNVIQLHEYLFETSNYEPSETVKGYSN